MVGAADSKALEAGPARALLLSVSNVQDGFRLLAGSVELCHGLLMVVWGLGLPLLVWRRFERLSRAYLWFSLTFVLGSLLSHALLHECVLTRLAYQLWEAGGAHAERVPFIVTFANTVARIRPSTDAAVLIWKVAIGLYCVIALFGWRTRERRAPLSAPSSARHPAGGAAS
jgi:hypothetical protein